MAMGGLYYEEFSVGQRFEHVLRRTVTEADNLLGRGAFPEAGLSG